MISEDRVEAALCFIRDKAEGYGQMVGRCRGLEHRRKVIRSQAFLAAEARSIAEREAIAETSAEYRAILDEIENAETERATLQTLMRGAEMLIEVWRTMAANQRRGNI